MADIDFDLPSNAGDRPAETVAVAAEPAAAPAAHDDLGAAKAGAKQVEGAEFDQEFGLESEDLGEEEGQPTEEVEVLTDEGDGDLEEKPEIKPDEKPDEGASDGEGESISDWMKDVDDDTRADIVEEFMESSPDVSITVRRGDQDVQVSLAQLKRDAAGYTGEQAVEAKIAKARAELKTGQDELKAREDFLSNQLTKPDDLLAFLDTNIPDPVPYYTALRDHAENVLKSAEDDPVGFKRDVSMRRESASLRSEMSEIKSLLKGIAKPDATAPDADDGTNASADKSTAEAKRVKDGEDRRAYVEDLGYDVKVVGKAWNGDGEPSDFYRWFAKWAVTHTKDTAVRARKSTNRNRRRGGKALRRRGGAGPPGGEGKGAKVTRPPNANEMAEFLVNHPSNKGRLT